jgi:predicted  nucleic acid-binding Zn-ribbon protein
MRSFVLLLIALSVWLLVERHHLSERNALLESQLNMQQRENAALQSRMPELLNKADQADHRIREAEGKAVAAETRSAELSTRVAQLETKIGSLSAASAQSEVEKKNWLQERIERGGRALEAEPRPSAYPGYSRPTTPGSRVIR